MWRTLSMRITLRFNLTQNSQDHVSDDERTRKIRSGVTPAKDHAIKQAHKVAAKRARPSPLPYVWVGNVSEMMSLRGIDFILSTSQLDVTTTEAELEELFSPCGKIHRVSLRRAGAWTIKPYEATLYASVEFRTSTGRTNALKLDGFMHDTNRRLVVSLFPATNASEIFKCWQHLMIGLYTSHRPSRVRTDSSMCVC